MAVNAQQSIAFDLSSGLPAARAANSTDVNRASSNANLRDVVEQVSVNPAEDIDRRRSETDVSVR